MSVEAIGNTSIKASIKASETKLPTMSMVNINNKRSQAAVKMTNGINTDPAMSRVINALPALEAIVTNTPHPKRTLSVKKATGNGPTTEDRQIKQIGEGQQSRQTLRLDESQRINETRRTQRVGEIGQNVETRQDKTAQESKQEQKYREVMTEKAVENANNRVRATRTNAKFEYNEDIKRITITIMDENQEVIKEIPSEETQKMLERLHTFTGMMLDKDV